MVEEAGAIERYVALLDASKIGMGLTVFARVWLTGQDVETVDHFTKEIRGLPQVLECHLMAGDCDFLLRVVAADLDAYQGLHRQAGPRHAPRPRIQEMADDFIDQMIDKGQPADPARDFALPSRPW